MKKRQLIEILILIVLIIIFAINFLSEQKTTNKKIKINCETACLKVGKAGWTFFGAGPISINSFSTHEDCVYACQTKFKKK
jgi:hypothetical protein